MALLACGGSAANTTDAGQSASTDGGTPTADGGNGTSKTVSAGETWVVSATTDLGGLTIESGGAISAPSGYSVTMTVNGVETGQRLKTTSGVDEEFAPGAYTGDIVLTVTKTNSVQYSGGGGSATFPIRQALYLGSSGVVADESVPAAATYSTAGTFDLTNLRVTSTGDDFDAVYATGGTWTLEKPTISLTGNGRSDFAGDGTAIVATGSATTLIVDGATISNQGVVRNAVVATGGASVIVKNSTITTKDGTLPTDYAQTVDTSQMRSAPWMLGINGTDNVRATNLLGSGTQAAYINSTLTSEGWGTLSTDSGFNCTLTVINSTVNNSSDGYGSYIIGNATEHFLGATLNVGGYAAINTGGVVNYADSTASAVSSLNSSLNLGLSSAELAALTPTKTTINSSRFGVMWHNSSGTVNVSGGTVFNTAEAVFLAKTSQSATIDVDGSGGAKLNPENGVILQVMDDDDPGPVNSMNTGVYTEPSGAPSAVSGFGATSTSSAVEATFSNISLAGDFYNGAGWGVSGRAQNMALTFNSSSITGVISSSEAHHWDSKTASQVTRIDSSRWYDIGEVENTPSAAIDNGAIVTLNSSTWTVTGTSYLTKLSLDSSSSVVAASGASLSMTVDGASTTLTPGQSYTGAIVLTEK